MNVAGSDTLMNARLNGYTTQGLSKNRLSHFSSSAYRDPLAGIDGRFLQRAGNVIVSHGVSFRASIAKRAEIARLAAG